MTFDWIIGLYTLIKVSFSQFFNKEISINFISRVVHILVLNFYCKSYETINGGVLI